MNKQWVAAALGVCLAACAEQSANGHDLDKQDGMAGADGEMVAGAGGDTAAGTAGTAGSEVAHGGTGGAAGSSPGCETAGAGGTSAAMDAGMTAVLEPDAGDPMLGSEPDDGDAGVETYSDAGASSTDAAADATLQPPDEPVLRAPQTGDLIVSEVMMDPTALTDAQGEWIELHNISDDVLDLTTCVVRDDRNDDFMLEGLRVQPGAYLALGRTLQAATVIDVVYSGMTLANAEDEIVIACGALEIDRVAYGPGFPRPAGRTMQLSANALGADTNDGADAWCAGTESGTPGAANITCE